MAAFFLFEKFFFLNLVVIISAKSESRHRMRQIGRFHVSYDHL